MRDRWSAFRDNDASSCTMTFGLLISLRRSTVLAFKKRKKETRVPESPDLLFRTLTRRKYPTEMPHQQAIMQAYVHEGVDKPDVALQLPTGSGKTLVGLLIAEWCRLKNNERVVYLCPTKQLVYQTQEQANSDYGLSVLAFTGSKHQYVPADAAKYRNADRVAITTYSSLFNINPFFDSADVVIIDDAHSAENYIATMWSIHISGRADEDKALFAAIASVLRPHIPSMSYARLVGDHGTTADSAWVDKLSTPVFTGLKEELSAVFDTHVEGTAHYYPWTVLCEHLDSCHLYYSAENILVRPMIPPTWTLPAFQNPRQRIFMSATLGAGGDLERLTGREPIHRLPVPVGFEFQGVGRRFFMFPGMTLEPAKVDVLRLRLMKRAKRSLVLAPSELARSKIVEQVKEKLGFPSFSADDIERSKKAFVAQDKAVAALANRYDGIDFPKDECRLLCVDGLPRAMNLQERFLMSRMGANILFNERVQTRVLQGVGRCTRSLEDYSAVFVTGQELQDYLSDPKLRKFFHPELQAELSFGVEQSMDANAADFVENFDTFIENGEEWDTINQQIVTEASEAVREPFPAMDFLSRAIKYEVRYQEFMWQGDYAAAMDSAQSVLGEISLEELRGYRALWHYLAGSAAYLGSQQGVEALVPRARQHFLQAKEATKMLPWLVQLSRYQSKQKENVDADADLRQQVEQLESVLVDLGTVDNRKFAMHEKVILNGLNSANGFELAHKMLGEMLGFVAGKQESDASPDPWWISREKCFVFEDHAGAKSSSTLGATKARQAASHPKWMEDNIPESHGLEMIPVLVTPVSKAMDGARPHLKEVYLWTLSDFRKWAQKALTVVRSLRSTLNPPCDLAWRAEASEALEANGLSAIQIADMLKARPASEHLTIVGKKA